MCPHCGYNLAAERRVALGELVYDPAGFAAWRGTVIDLTGAEHATLGALVHARGRILPRALIAERIGYEGEGNIVDVYLSRLRSALRRAGAPAALIQNVRRRGHRLQLELLTGQNLSPSSPPLSGPRQSTTLVGSSS